MDIDLRVPSGEQCKEDEMHDGMEDSMLDSDEKLQLHNGDLGNMLGVGEEERAEDVNSSGVEDMVMFKEEDTNLEPLSGMEFESHGEAYSFYQEYARSMGFNTAIQNSRRSKTSREFIDAKFACSRYGTKREYDKSSFNHRPRSRQSKQDPENSTGRRSCLKTDCKASMHVKRKPDGKWVIHSFVKEHNHELLPAQAVSEQTRRMYATMARQFAEYKNVVGLKNDPKNPFDHKSRNFSLEAGDSKMLLEFFTVMQNMNSNFFYAIDLGREDQRLKNLLWIDAKSRHDYNHFCDVVSLDMTYVRNKYKMPLALFIGVNQHYQFILLGCALISDESTATFSWLMQTWRRAMGGQTPKVIITDQDEALKSVISGVFPDARHVFSLWHILGKISENLSHVIKQHENFMAKFEECIYRSCTDDEFIRKWWEILDRFELKEDEWIKLLYESRKNWAPSYMDVLLAGMSTAQRADSVNSYFDKYVHKKTPVQEFVKQYESILQDRYEEEAKADADTWNKQPTLRSPSPFEKSIAGVYTRSVFKKFQEEVLGAVACHPKKENDDGTNCIFKVQDHEKKQDFLVYLNEMKPQVSCMCRLYEYKGYLCRHATVVLQMCGLSAIPSQYILKRWTKDAKSRHLFGDESELVVQSRVHRYNGLCQRAMKLSEEGSLSQESYSIAFRALEEAYGTCLSVNTSSSKSLVEAVTSPTHGLICIDEEDNQSRSTSKTNKKKNPTKKKKGNSEQDIMTVGAQESLQQVDKLSPRPVTLEGYFGSQPSVQGMVQLNLMAPRDNYYGNQQQAMQGLGQLNTMPTNPDSYYASMPAMGQMDFFRNHGFYIRQDDPRVGATQLHDDASHSQGTG